jgi:inorganic pyrophosphatase
VSGEGVVFVEAPSGVRHTDELAPERGATVLDRRLSTAMTYPADDGCIEGTVGGDGDPPDALVLAHGGRFVAKGDELAVSGS